MYLNLRPLLPEEERGPSIHLLPFPPGVAKGTQGAAAPSGEHTADTLAQHVGAMQRVIVAGWCLWLVLVLVLVLLLVPCALLFPSACTVTKRKWMWWRAGRTARDRRQLSLKIPAKSATVLVNSDEQVQGLEMLRAYVTAELNLRELVVQTADRNDTKLEATPDARQLGKRLGTKFKPVAAAVKALPSLTVREVGAPRLCDRRAIAIARSRLCMPLLSAIPCPPLFHSSPVRWSCPLVSPVSCAFLCLGSVYIHEHLCSREQSSRVRAWCFNVLGAYSDDVSTCLASSLGGQLRDQGQVSVAGQVVQAHEVHIARKFVGSQDMLEAVVVEDMGGALLLMDMQVDEEALMLSTARDLINRVQKLKKKAGVSPSDELVLAYQVLILQVRLRCDGRIMVPVVCLSGASSLPF